LTDFSSRSTLSTMKTTNFAAAVMAACMASASPIALIKRAGTTYNGGTTANDVTDGVCAALTLICARGTSETGNMGTVVCPGLATSLISDLGASMVAVQGVTYPASIESIISLGADGGPTMASLAEQAISQCPSTKVVLAGYSQGALVTHYATASADLPTADVGAIVVYGDPENGEAFGSVSSSLVKSFCASGDDVCQDDSFEVTAAHLSYESNGDLPAGATFAEQVTGV